MKAIIRENCQDTLKRGNWKISIKAGGWDSIPDAPEGASGGAARRSFLKLTAAAFAAPLLLTSLAGSARSRRREDEDDDDDDGGDAGVLLLPPSPPTIPWQFELPAAIDQLQPIVLDPPPMVVANTAAGEAGRGPHQCWSELYETPRQYPPVHYELSAKENSAWVFNPAYPPQRIWGYEGNTPGATTPGPTIFARYGQPTIVRMHNRLPQDHVGFGTPEISTHLHNMHTASESDGFPSDYYSVNKAGPTLASPGEFKDHFYANIYAGYDELQNGIGDLREALGTLFYHDHTMDFTAPNVVRGLMGFFLIFDHIDSGDERDPSPSALRLPSYPYDYPLDFSDRIFDQNGIMLWDQVNPEGLLGDKVIVNGYIEPVLRVAARKYRLRLLNGGPSRFYELYLVRPDNVVQTFTYIGNDGNLLPAPLFNQYKVRLGVTERADIVVDFSRYPLGTELYLVNRLTHRPGETRRPKDVRAPGDRLLKIIVDRYPPEQDVSQVPAVLRELRPLDPAEIAAAPLRRWDFDRANGMWTVNGEFFDPKRAAAKIAQGGVEVWELFSVDDGWSHPIHIHFEEGRIISKTVEGKEVPVPPHELGRKDVFVLNEISSIKLLLRFRDFYGKYVMHCHNLIHEDHAMMVRWDIVADPSLADQVNAPAAEDEVAGPTVEPSNDNAPRRRRRNR
ncbi:multicopper oxidase family protein [Pseudomonas sp.]|uniref:multicopper oxidase family protein n=1 Tax=Pseudomonas sp. TaxID=306 RepID=UPI00299E11E6|nr:multicopper oxidase domain-containing protein [Pseudomonas sp.]MDX1369052.1 multicopper oxidase domain-containing protein [Pseudomonas sp.]